MVETRLKRHCLENGVQFPRFQTSTDLFSDPKSPAYIRPDSRVLLVGPGQRLSSSLTLPMDCGVFAMSEYLDHFAGALDIIGLPAGRFQEGGVSDIVGLRTTMKELFAAAYIKPPPTRYFEADIHSFSAPTRYDVIWDHSTYVGWIAKYQLAKNVFLLSAITSSLLKYIHLLKTNGRILLFYNSRIAQNVEVVSQIVSIFDKDFEDNVQIEGCSITQDVYDISDRLYGVLAKLTENNTRFSLLTKGKVLPSYSDDAVLVLQRNS